MSAIAATLCLSFSFLLVTPLVGQSTSIVLRIVEGTKTLPSTEKVRLSRFSDASEHGLAVEEKLFDGDMVSSPNGGVLVEIQCPAENGTILKLEGSFRVLITDSSEDCRIKLAAGTVEVLTEKPTQVTTAGLVLGSEGTQYSWTAGSTETNGRGTALLFAGESLSISSSTVSRSIRPGSGSVMDGTGREIERLTQIPEPLLQRSAAIYARFDVAQAAVGNPDLRTADARSELVREMEVLHADALRRPRNEADRVRLARAQLEQGNAAGAFRQLREASVLSADALERNGIDFDQLAASLSPSDRRILEGGSGWTAPPGARIFVPEFALASGTLVGTVISQDGQPLAGAPVQIGTISGTVTRRTNEKGRFTTDVPTTGLIRFIIDGVDEEAEIPIKLDLPRDLLERPPEFVERRSVVDLRGDFDDIELESGSATTSMPIAKSLGPDPTRAMTRYRIPDNAPRGAVNTILTDRSGRQTTHQSIIYSVAASIDQEDLRGGQNAAFVFTFDFGERPPGEVQIQLHSTGPINYKKEGRLQRLQIDRTGQAVFTGTLRAKRGITAPFTLAPTLRFRP